MNNKTKKMIKNPIKNLDANGRFEYSWNKKKSFKIAIRCLSNCMSKASIRNKDEKENIKSKIIDFVKEKRDYRSLSQIYIISNICKAIGDRKGKDLRDCYRCVQTSSI